MAYLKNNYKLTIRLKRCYKIGNKLFKPIYGFENYFGCSDGRIYKYTSDSRFKQLSMFQQPGSKYLKVSIKRKGIKETFSVHYLIARSFRKLKNECDKIIHKDKNPLNNIPKNLKLNKNETVNYKRAIIKYELDVLEQQFKEKINFNFESKEYKDYEKIKSASVRARKNWLKMFLK